MSQEDQHPGQAPGDLQIWGVSVSLLAKVSEALAYEHGPRYCGRDVLGFIVAVQQMENEWLKLPVDHDAVNAHQSHKGKSNG